MFLVGFRILRVLDMLLSLVLKLGQRLVLIGEKDLLDRSQLTST